MPTTKKQLGDWIVYKPRGGSNLFGNIAAITKNGMINISGELITEAGLEEEGQFIDLMFNPGGNMIGIRKNTGGAGYKLAPTGKDSISKRVNGTNFFKHFEKVGQILPKVRGKDYKAEIKDGVILIYLNTPI